MQSEDESAAVDVESHRGWNRLVVGKVEKTTYQQNSSDRYLPNRRGDVLVGPIRKVEGVG